MKKYSLVEELQDKNATILQKSSNQAMEIAELKAQSVELIDKMKNLEEVNKELQDKMFEQNNEIQSARLGMQEAEAAAKQAEEVLLAMDDSNIVAIPESSFKPAFEGIRTSTTSSNS